jgi:hypothetical protein
MSPRLQTQGDLFAERGYTVQTATAEGPTTWRAELRIGVYIGERFIYRANPIRREFPRTDGLLNHLLDMAQEAHAIVVTLPSLDEQAPASAEA